MCYYCPCAIVNLVFVFIISVFNFSVIAEPLLWDVLLLLFFDVDAVHCVSEKNDTRKNDTDVTYYRFNPYQPISVIFGRDVAEGVCYWMVIYYPTSPN